MKLECTAQRSGPLSSFLRQELQLSTGLIRRLKTRDAILADGRPCHTNVRIEPGTRICIILEEEPADFPPEPLPFSILYEDEYILVADKPAGMLVHPSPNRSTGTLANRVTAYYRQTNQPCAFHPVTRLDRDTFGLVLIAKHACIHERLIRLHKAGRLQKIYRAWVYGGPAADSGVIEAPIARCPWPSLLREVSPQGQPARSEYRVLERREEASLLELRPITGRTHQLRLHCTWSGFPILGDPQYGTEASRAYSADRGLLTQQLQATQLLFPHPVTGEPLAIRSRLSLPEGKDL